MAEPVLTKVRPIFKLKVGAQVRNITDKRYLYAIQLRSITAMVPGGDYYLGNDSRPSYPNNKTKPKPIPVAKYVFHLSKRAMSKADIEKLTRADCYEPVKLSDKPNQTVYLRAPIPDYVYIMGTDPEDAPPKKRFYDAAQVYFRWEKRYPQAWIKTPQEVTRHFDQISFKELLGDIKQLQKPFRDIYIVSHATAYGSLTFPIARFEDQTSYQTLWTLQKDDDKQKAQNEEERKRLKKQNRAKSLLEEVAGQLSGRNTIHIRGCNIGQNQDTLNLLAKIFGGKSTVTAPKHRQFYDSREYKRGQQIVRRKAWEYFRTYCKRYQGLVKASGRRKRKLATDFQAKYTDSDPKMWKRLVRKAKRKPRVLRGPPHTRFDLPPHNKGDKAVLNFAKKHFAAEFNERQFSPKSFHERQGPKRIEEVGEDPYTGYVYRFSGDLYDPRRKKWIPDSWYEVHREVHPTDAEVLKAEQARHPMVQWYKWSVKKKTLRGGKTEYRAQGVATLFTIDRILKDANGKIITAEVSNTKYYGQSQ